jgi:glycosyltransferase involved in cell wall biosynthesis
MPAYMGADHIGEALACLQEQTFTDFDVMISVDGDDQETAAACRPFLSDERFSLTVQPERLDWQGNFNWLLAQPLGEFFCYRQHDDLTAPNFFQSLVWAAEGRPEAACVYADCQWFGGRNDIEIAPPIEGADVLRRMRQFIEQKEPAPVRGLFRSAAVLQAGPVRADEFRALSEVFVWLAKVLRWGPFLRWDEPLYLRRDHAGNYHKTYFDWPDAKRRGSWTTLFTGLLEAVMPVCSTPEERLFFQQFILDRISVVRPGQSYHYEPPTAQASGELMRECVERLAQEGNLHRLDIDEVPGVLQAAARVLPLKQEVERLTAENAALRAAARRRTSR